MNSQPLYLLACFSIVATPFAAADEQDKPAAEPASPETIQVSGVFEAVTASEIKLNTKHLKSFVITKLLPHGTTVSKGRNVVWFDSEEPDREIRKAEVDLRLSRLTLEDDEFAHKQFLETQRLDRQAAEREKKRAQQNHDNFVKVDRQRQLETAEFNLKSSQASLANAVEELKQLEQMYKEDDLTEESEEIVLKRAKQSVEAAEFRLEGTQILTQRTIRQTVPQADATQSAALSRALLTYQKALRDLSSARTRQEIEMSKKRESFKEAEKKVQQMRAERGQIVLQAAHDGIVFHGSLNRGKLGDKPGTLAVGSKVTNEQTIATVAAPGRLRVRIDLPEAQLQTAVVGTKCRVLPHAFPDAKLDATVKSVSRVPYAGTKFDCVVTFRPAADMTIMPTMTCDVEFTRNAKTVDGD